MKLIDYIETLTKLEKELTSLTVVTEKANESLNKFKSYDINEPHAISLYIANTYKTIYLDTDLLVNALEQQIEKNEATSNEILEEIKQMKLEEITL